MRLGSVVSAILAATLMIAPLAPVHAQLFPPFGSGGGGGNNGGGGSTTPTGPAGGDLSGTYPNPTVVAMHGQALTVPPAIGPIFANTGTDSTGTPNPFSIAGALTVSGMTTLIGATDAQSEITVMGTLTVEPTSGATNNGTLVIGGGTAANPGSITATSTRAAESIRVAPKGSGVLEITNASAGSGTNSVNGGFVQYIPATTAELLDGTTFTCSTAADLGKVGAVSDGDTLTGAAFDAPVVTPTTGPAFRLVACLQEGGATSPIAWVYH